MGNISSEGKSKSAEIAHLQDTITKQDQELSSKTILISSLQSRLANTKLHLSCESHVNEQLEEIIANTQDELVKSLATNQYHSKVIDFLKERVSYHQLYFQDFSL